MKIILNSGFDKYVFHTNGLVLIYRLVILYYICMEKIELKIEGMHCGACATGIQMLVSSMEGVSNVFVDYEGKKGTLEFDPAKVTKDAIVKAIAELGYTAS